MTEDLSSERRPSFAEIDREPTERVAMIGAVLQATAAHPDIQRLRSIAVRELRPAPGQRLLDAGSGRGEVARHLAALVGTDGEVVALDNSAALTAIAREHHDGSAVRYMQGDITALDLPDDHFDGVRSERVLQHLADPDLAIAELLRVTRPGGRVCLIDTDWDSLAIDGVPPDLPRQVRDSLGAAWARNADLGRTLRRRLRRAGVADVTAAPVTCYFPDLTSIEQVVPSFGRQVPPGSGALPADLDRRWLAALAEADSTGDFLAALTIWIAAGTVPNRGA